MEHIIGAVKAVQAIQAVGLDTHTFFTEFDEWQYHAVSDNVLCTRCLGYSQKQTYSGDELLENFPDLEIIGPNEIMLNIHINCRCYLTRITQST